MTSQKTEVHGLAIRRWRHYKTRRKADELVYTSEYRRFMVWVGRCIKRGGAVTLTTYVVGGEHGLPNEVYDKLDATLDWRGT